ncbi:MAG TPA: PQQ-binding-like beta-propeller repeat protein [Actinomycetota bacterium]|jgi:outer membrane protein assembly factor BamB
MKFVRSSASLAILAVALVAIAVAAMPALAVTSPAGNSMRAGAAIDWPQFRFDDNHTGVNPFETTLNASNVRRLTNTWQAQLGDLVDFSSPTVVDGVVYIGSSDGTLWAFPANGCGASLCTHPLWKSTNLSQIIDTPTVANGFVYVGSQTSPTSNDGKLDVFSAAGCGQAVCPPLWQGNAGTESILESSPTVANGVVYVGTFGKRLFAFDANGCGQSLCQALWQGVTGGSVESTPTVANGVVFVGADDGKLYAFDANGCGQSTCQALWSASTGKKVGIFESSPAISHGTVFIASQHALAAFDANGCGQSTCQPLWNAPNLNSFYGGSPAVAGNRVYIGLEGGVAVFAAGGCGGRNCQPLWLDFGAGEQGAILSSPTVANGVVYAGRNTGDVLAWKAGPCGHPICTQIWTGFTNEPIVTSSPTVVNGQVYIGSADNAFPENISGRIYVFGLST